MVLKLLIRTLKCWTKENRLDDKLAADVESLCFEHFTLDYTYVFLPHGQGNALHPFGLALAVALTLSLRSAKDEEVVRNRIVIGDLFAQTVGLVSTHRHLPIASRVD